MTSRRRRASQGWPSVQLLEPRRLFAITAQIVGQQLQVTGTDEGESVRFVINDQTGDIELRSDSDQLFTYDPGDFTSVVVDVGGGADVVDCGPLDVPVTVDGGEGIDSLIGGSGDDALFGRETFDTLEGRDGDDTLEGGGRADTLIGGNGDDVLLGQADDDSLDGGLGSDVIDGGSFELEGNRVDYAQRTEDLSITLDGVANDGATGENDNVLLCDIVDAGSGDDLLVGNGRTNSLRGGDGADTLLGLGGDDRLFGGGNARDASDANLVDGGSGNDDVFGGEGADSLVGGGGDDSWAGFGGNDTIDGGSGNDSGLDGEGDDVVRLGAGNDQMNGVSAGSDTIDGGSGDDTLMLGRHDEVGAATGNDSILGQGGNDTLIFELPQSDTASPATLSGGSGVDHLRVRGFDGNTVDISLDGVANDGGPSDTTNVLGDWEHLSTFAFDVGPADYHFDASALSKSVTLQGGTGNDTLIGGGSADLLEGDVGDDSLSGNAGEDVLRGGRGNDVLIGGAGQDSFNGGPQQDDLHADDGEIDLVNGSSGLMDEADVDAGLDVVSNVETVT